MEAQFTITLVQLYGDRENFGANLVINDTFLMHYDMEGNFSVPNSKLASWRDDDAQDYASDTYNAGEIADATKALEAIEEAKEFTSNWF
ncbi:MAG: hypothetical protein WCA04_14100 [Geobacteraceae bacterium]